MQEFTGIEYLKIDIANNYGLDQLTWNERIDWFNIHQSVLSQLTNKAEKPALFYAGIQAYIDAVQGKPIGYPVSLDATSSGLQILAVLTCDRKAAQICNVIPTGSREDAYTWIYNWMLNKIGEASKINREDTKKAIMTALYSSEAVPKKVFGEGMLLQIFLTAMMENAPFAWELNNAFLALWNPDAYSHDWILPDNFHVHVKVMDYIKETVHFKNEPFEIMTKVNRPTKEGRSLGANTVHSVDGMIVREMVRRCSYDPHKIDNLKLDISIYKHTVKLPYTNLHDTDSEMVTTLWEHYQNSGYLSARILNHLNLNTLHLVQLEPVEELINSLPKKPFEILTVHDCFRCLPHYANDLRKQYNLQLALIAKSNLLQYLLTQITGRIVTFNKPDNLYNEILTTEYALS